MGCLCVYVLLTLGKYHPIHSKTLLAVSGMISVVFSYIEAIGFSYFVGI